VGEDLRKTKEVEKETHRRSCFVAKWQKQGGKILVAAKDDAESRQLRRKAPSQAAQKSASTAMGESGDLPDREKKKMLQEGEGEGGEKDISLTYAASGKEREIGRTSILGKKSHRRKRLSFSLIPGEKGRGPYTCGKGGGGGRKARNNSCPGRQIGIIRMNWKRVKDRGRTV